MVIMARRVHQPSRHRNRHRRPHRRPATTTDTASALQTTYLNTSSRCQRTVSARWSTPNHSPGPQAPYPTVHNLVTTTRQFRQAAWLCMQTLKQHLDLPPTCKFDVTHHGQRDRAQESSTWSSDRKPSKWKIMRNPPSGGSCRVRPQPAHTHKTT